MSTIAERVQAGAALLDEKAPGWERRIDVKRLDLEWPCDCVLGQEYGNYYDGVEKLGLHVRMNAYEFGFAAVGVRYASLTRAWKRLIRARLAASGDDAP